MKRLVRPQRQLSKKYQRLQHQKHSQEHRRRPRRQPQFISKGRTVEVSTEEEGFHGAWFTATVVRDKRRSTGKVYVEYKDLLRDDDPSKQLREYVKADLIRPEPPVEDHHRETFNVGDAVDAFHDDGWWTGTLTEVKDSGFVVFFENPPHHIEFKLSVLRIHREWIKGAWVPPVNQETAAENMYFCKEKRVEVSFDGAYPDVWFPATVLEDKGNGAFLVECEQSDGKGGSFIRNETVNSLHIRPFPPFSNSKNFLLLEKVDAFYDFGWWSGVITKELAGSRYLVNINHTKKDREFAISELRASMEWKHGDWYTESQDASIPSYHKNNENSIGKNENNIGLALPLTNSVSKKSSSQEKTTISSTSMLKEIELAVPGNDTPLVFDSSPKSYEKSSHVASPDYVSVESDILSADQSHEGHSSRKRTATKRAKNVEKEESALIGSRNTRENKVQVKILQDSAGGKEGNEAEDSPGDCLTGVTNLPIILGLACDNTRTPGSKRSYRSNGERTAKRGRVWGNSDETKLHAVKVSNRLEAVDGNEKKKRGRPRKSFSQASIPSTDDVNVAASKEASTLGQVLATNCCSGVGLSNDQMKQENQLGSIKSATSPSSIGGENVVEASSKPHSSTDGEIAVEALKKAPSSTGGENAEEASRKPREKLPTKRGKKRTTNLNVISKVQDVTSPNSVEGNTAEESNMNEESPNNTSDNQPLAKWLGILHSPTWVDSSRSSLTRCNAEAISEHMEVVEEGITTAASVAAAAADDDEITRPVGIELQNLPFEKKSMLWSALESMEIFQKLPQKPHFQPLEHVKETVREGLAIGSMVTFTGVVEKTSKLQFDDTKESIDAILETLLELETHGFDVGAIRERVIYLGQMKEKQAKLEEEVEKLNSEMTEQEVAKSKIDKEIEEINRQISELKEKLSGVTVLNLKKTGEIESLQMKLKGVEDDISSIRSEFEGHGSWP